MRLRRKLLGFLLGSIPEETPFGSFGGTHTKFVADLGAILPALLLNFLNALGIGNERVIGGVKATGARIYGQSGLRFRSAGH